MGYGLTPRQMELPNWPHPPPFFSFFLSFFHRSVFLPPLIIYYISLLGSALPFSFLLLLFYPHFYRPLLISHICYFIFLPPPFFLGLRERYDSYAAMVLG